VARYNLTKVAPDGTSVHHAFDEVRDSLGWALASLGHEVSTTENWFSEVGETNIIFGAELIADFQRLPPNSIIYNLEQFSHPQMDKVRNLAKGLRVWDFSHRQTQDWKDKGFNCTHVPIGCTPNLYRIPSKQKDIDVFFAGFLTPRRVDLVEKLRKAGLKVAAPSNCYGGARDNLIARSKVCLNVHHDGRDMFEIVRCSYLMANGKLVVTESSSDDDEYQDIKNGLVIAPYRNLLDVCGSYCMPSADGERSQIEERAAGLIQYREYSLAVAEAIDPFDRTLPPFSRPMQAKIERAEHRKSYMTAAREIPKSRDPRVAARYKLASEQGDMKDFVSWMRNNAKGNVVEIGVRDGASTSAFLAGVEENGGHVYSIDVQPCGHLFEGHPQWSFLQANSTDVDAMCKFIPFEIDLLLIDGDHSRAGVLNDIEYCRQLRTGGMVLFHDIAPEEKPAGCSDMSWPGDDVKNVYTALCNSMVPLGWTHMELPGKYGMGVLKKPEAVPAKLPELAEK